MSNIKCHCLEAQFLGDPSPVDMGWAEFPQGPSGWATINGQHFNIAGFRWVVTTNSDQEAYLELFLLTPENLQKAQVDQATKPGLVAAPRGTLELLKSGSRN